MQNFSITSWNVQKKAYYAIYTSFKKIKSHLSKITSEIIVLQEMCDAEKAFKDVEFLKSYNIYIPGINKAEEDRKLGYNYNVILSKYPILKVDEISFPEWRKNINLQNCTRADIQLENKILRIYNCHFIISKAGIKTRLKQLEYILFDASSHKGPVVICGDLNATIPKVGWNRWIISCWHHEPKEEMFVGDKFIDYDERELFDKTLEQYGFRESLDLYTPTWSFFKSKIWEIFGLKLDWFMVKNLETTSVHLGNYVSDHKSIEVHCRV